ncbi:MAG: hypothetical protein AAGK97_14120, partial [Bacteroidota bacterium]
FNDAANKAYVDAHVDGDANPNNEVIANITLNNNTLTITEAGVNHNVNLSSLGSDDLGNHTATQALDMDNNRINGLGFPSSANDAATKSYVDAHMDGDANALNELVTSVTLTNTTLSVAEGANIQTVNLATLKDDLGDHIADQRLNMALERIINVGAPSNVNDATTKGYVDAHTDADASPFNEIQSLSFNNGLLSISNGNSVNLTGVGNTLISDLDGDTKVTTEGPLPDQDEIYFDIGGKRLLKIFDRLPLSAAGLPVMEFLNNRGNVLIGNRVGENMNNPNTDNILIGDNAGRSTISSGAVYIGREAGALVSSINPNAVCIGYKAGSSYGPALNNTFIGYKSGIFIVEGNNTFLGSNSGGNSSLTERAVIVGSEVAPNLNESAGCVMIGYNALDQFVEGNFNTAVGSKAAPDYVGADNSNNNTFLGYNAGNDFSLGEGSTFIGASTKGQVLGTT